MDLYVVARNANGDLKLAKYNGTEQVIKNKKGQIIGYVGLEIASFTENGSAITECE